MYPLTRFLAKHAQIAVKVEGTKEWVRTNQIINPAVEEYGAEDPEKVKISTKGILRERDERLEKQQEILERLESKKSFLHMIKL